MSTQPGDAPPAPVSTADMVEGWLKETYLIYNTKEQNELAQNRCIITVGEFIDILRTSGNKSWFEHSVIDLALALLTDSQNRTGCYVLPIPDVQQLCQLGLGTFDVDYIEGRLKQVLSDKCKRWIIVPCNDGMLENNFVIPESEQRRVAQQKAKGNEKSARRDATKRETRKALGRGAHWGLMIVDTQKQTARWLDGLLDLGTKEKEGKRVVYIESMLNAGAAAGMVLRGYDKLLGREPGKFTTSTIKWVPHQRSDNSGTADAGACGPHMFACLKHMFETPEALEDVYAHFRRGNAAPGNFRRNRKGFNSTVTRKQISNQIREERERQEANPELSLRLTPELLDILKLRLTPGRLLQAVQDFKAAANGPDEHEHTDVKQARTVQARHDLKRSYEQQWLVDQKNPDTIAVLEAAGITTLSQYVDYRQYEGDILGRNDGSSNKPDDPLKGRTQDIYLGSKSYSIWLEDKEIWPPHATDSSKWPKNVKRLPDFAKMKRGRIGDWLKCNPDLHVKIDTAKKANDHTRRAVLHHAFRKTFLGEPDESFDKFWSKDPTVFNPHDADFAAIKKNKDSRVRCGEMRLIMMRHYEGEDAVRRVTHPKTKSAAGGSNRKDDDDDDNGNNDAGKGGTNGSDKDNGNNNYLPDDAGQFESDDEGDRFNDAYRSGNDNNNTEPHTNNTEDNNEGIKGGANSSRAPTEDALDTNVDSNTGRINTGDNNGEESNAVDDKNAGNDTNGVTLPTIMLQGVWNFRTMREDELMTHVTPAIRNDPRVKNVKHGVAIVEPNAVSWRALCFVEVSGGRFDNENDKDCQDLWLHDPLVFSELQRLLYWKPEEIMKMMANHYHPRTPTEEEEPKKREGLRCPGPNAGNQEDDVTRNFSDEGSTTEEDDIQQVLTNVISTTGNKRKFTAGETPLTKKPRLSAPEFLSVSEEELALWLPRVPFVIRQELLGSKRQLGNIRSARIWLERMFGEGFKHMRNESPLSETSMKKLRQWQWKLNAMTYPKSQKGMKDFLEMLLKDPVIGGKLVEIPDLRKKTDELGNEMGASEGILAPNRPTESTIGIPEQSANDSLSQQVETMQNDLARFTNSGGDENNSNLDCIV